jgi:HD-like signal output (HDOD) protein
VYLHGQSTATRPHIAKIEPQEQELKQRLPSQDGVALAIMDACRKYDVALANMATLVQSGPALTGRLLERAKAAAMGLRPVVSVPAAGFAGSAAIGAGVFAD